MSRKKIGPYTLWETLGQGPSGIVYRAGANDGEKEVALKVVVLSGEEGQDSLLRDLRATNSIHAATSLRHPGIAHADRVDTIEGQAVTEMEYVRGMSLRDLLGIAGSLRPERAVPIAAQILDALAYAHARSTLHRDLKPSNVLIRSDGLVKLTDFGFRQTCAAPNSVKAAPVYAYLAPEEFDASLVPDRRSDLWSVGTMLFQMLTGRLPFPMTDLNDSRAWKRGLSLHTPASLSLFLPDAPASLQTVLDRALARDLSERYANAREFLNALIATGLFAGVTDSDSDQQERQEATCKRIDRHLRAQLDAPPDVSLLDLARVFTEKNPDCEENENLLRYADLLHQSARAPEEPEPHSIALTAEEMDHLEEIETRLQTALKPESRPADSFDINETFKPEVPGLAAPPLADSLLANLSDPASALGDLSDSESLSVRKSRFETLFNPKDGAELIFLPAGEFIMGSNGYSEDNAPKRVVFLDACCFYKYPVTVMQYRRFCGETGHPMPHAYWQWEEMHPIVGVSWHDAQAYCEWADAHLPTEAQWEKAARGVDGRAFPWGDQFDQRSDHRLIPRNAGKTVAVGSYPSGSSPYGLMDMVGNIQQWCFDLYDEDYYKTAPNENPPGPAVSKRHRATKSGLVQKLFNKNMPQPTQSAEQRVARGSSWKDYHESFAYTFRRDTFPPDVMLPWVGFRCVASFVPARPD